MLENSAIGRWVTPREAAEILEVTPKQASELARRGLIGRRDLPGVAATLLRSDVVHLAEKQNAAAAQK